ncbi:unnamed protein product [Brachionus calyciflorus]|uniref:EGF-like domain-containing protein n=1 Tax=Brachionus calyciflorus TaxID=104777 RepID=A0A813YYC9_9BILA|nr:unnamed protein product [Brachionus calyciflorus]
MNLKLNIFLIFIFRFIQNQPTSKYNVELETVDRDVFNEIAPKNFHYDFIIQNLKLPQPNPAIFPIIDEVLFKINKTYFNLDLVGHLMGEHKFKDLDWRNHSMKILKSKNNHFFNDKTFDKDFKLMSSFPSPKISNPFPDIEEFCDQSAYECLNYISEIVEFNIAFSLLNISKIDMGKILIEEKRFMDRWQLFNFRATASYYLCWFTLNKNPLFKKFYDNECPFKIGTKRDFKCAETLFCPDPCCGKVIYNLTKEGKFNWSILDSKCKASSSNPCFNFKNKTCELSYDFNKNFDDLKDNKLNVSCNCEKGFRYSVEFKNCIDIDECVELSHKCDIEANEVCLNVKGGYECICKMGFILNKSNLFDSKDKCVEEKHLFDFD